MSNPWPTLPDPIQLEQQLQQRPERYWLERGETMALGLFHAMAERVPAYKDFLHKNGVDASKITSASDLKLVPTTDKDNYLKAYPRRRLCWDGNFGQGAWVISSTSGSTGKPFYFPRQSYQDEQYALMAEVYLRTNFAIHQRSTLYIDAFAMGTWIGGVFTYQAVKLVAERGNYNLAITTPGINLPEVVNQVRELGADFDQVIIGCYPPVLKDIIDLGIEQGLDWGDYNLGIVFSAEGFNERFRDYIIKKAKLAHPLLSTLNHYGTVDQGTLSYETPLSAMIRRLAVENESLYEHIFSQPYKLPTLTQYLPEMFYFEEDNNRLICSSYSGIPLVRYDLKDHGGVISFGEMASVLEQHGVDLAKEATAQGIAGSVWQLPFVQVFERADFSVGFLGFQVYPETIRKALLTPELHEKVTGKFTMMSDYDDASNPRLQIHVELKPGVLEAAALKKQVSELVVGHLIKENSEFRVNFETFPDRVQPEITFWPHQHPVHFSLGGKHKWVKK